MALGEFTQRREKRGRLDRLVGAVSNALYKGGDELHALLLIYGSLCFFRFDTISTRDTAPIHSGRALIVEFIRIQSMYAIPGSAS